MAKGSKNSYMRDETFAELMDSARQVLAYESGERENYRVTRVEIPASTKSISAGKVISQGSPRNIIENTNRHPAKSNLVFW